VESPDFDIKLISFQNIMIV